MIDVAGGGENSDGASVVTGDRLSPCRGLTAGERDP